MNKIISFLFIFIASCKTEYSVITKEEVQVIETDKETEIIIDFFVQPEKPENLDVLVILDTSCSMSDNYENVSLGLDLLRGDIEILTYDYQMALINSSLNDPYFAGIIYPDASSMEIFLAPYSLGVDRFEEAFISLYQFTTTPEGEDFLREGVDKLYIFVSDEPEQSIMPVSLFVDWMIEYHQDVVHDVIVIGITEYSVCDIQYYPGPDDENRFLTLANHYDKMVVDICGDFQLALAENSFLIKPITHINLSRRAEAESIVVYQDGIKEENWYYLNNTNTVYFDFEISEGAVIKIGYETIIN